MAKLTLTGIKSCTLAPGEKERTFWDDDLKGFGLRVRDTGAKVFVVQYRNEFGRQKKLTLGRFGKITPHKARELAQDAVGAVLSGKDPQTEKQRKRKAATVAELCDQYLREGEGSIKPSTLLNDRSRIETHVKPLIGNRAIEDINGGDIRRMVLDIEAGKTAKPRKEKGRGGVPAGGSGVARRTVGMLHTIFQIALRDNAIAQNPCAGVHKPKDVKRKVPFSFERVAALGEALRRAENEGLNSKGVVAIRLLLLSGCRRQEILGLKWSEVDERARCFRFIDTKTGPQVRPAGASALRLVTEQPRKGEHVFPATSGEGHYVGLPRVWAKVVAWAGLDDVPLHGLRHWHASAAAEMNFSELTIAGLLGHSVRGVTGRYATAPDSALVAAADRVSAKLSRALAGGIAGAENAPQIIQMKKLP